MKNRLTFRRQALIATVACSLGACASGPGLRKGGDEGFRVALPPGPVSPDVNGGAIYSAASSQSLFADYKARRIGDVLTVLLSEQTNARKSANSSSARSSSVQVTDPLFGGRPITNNGVPIFNTDLEGEQSFDGEGEAAQSNLLEGSITVTVSDVLANGNLVVRGEKWIRINHGEEYIRLRGIVRPVDISAENTVLSTQVADAELAYGGTGHVAQSSVPGWLTRFFSSRLWPF